MFPDDTPPDYNSISKLQAFFMDWFREERQKELLTYPVLTAAILIDEKGEPKDGEFADMLAYEMSKGLSFFIYESKSADSLASCCRLRNELADNTFSYTLGAGGVSAGSFRVITINMNRYVQLYEYKLPFSNLVKRVHKYLVAHREVIKDYIKANMLPAYRAKFITLDHQFGTVGINGMLEAMEFKQLSPESKDIGSREGYKHQVGKYLELIYKIDKEDAKTYGFRFNCECVPAEGLGVKNAQWDKHDGLCLNRDCYNSYFYPVESQDMTILDKLDCHGKNVTRYLDGGSAVHLNIAQLLTERQALDLMRIAGRLGVNYWTFNCLVTICDNCGYINVNTENHCTKCGETEKIDHGTRVIGYLKRVSSYSKERQEEAAKRFYSRR